MSKIDTQMGMITIAPAIKLFRSILRIFFLFNLGLLSPSKIQNNLTHISIYPSFYHFILIVPILKS
jgi:hypothetical protein